MKKTQEEINSTSELNNNNLKDLFENGSANGFDVIKNYFTEVNRTLGMVKEQSLIVSDYFNQILLNQTKNHFRHMLKYVTYIILIICLEGAIRSPGAMTLKPPLMTYMVFPILILYIMTLRSVRTFTTHNMYVLTSTWLCVILVLIIQWSRVTLLAQDHHGLHSPVILFIVGVFVLLPIRSSMCFCLILLMFMITFMLELSSFLKIVNYNSTNVHNDSSHDKLMITWKYFDLYKRLRLSLSVNDIALTKQTFNSITFAMVIVRRTLIWVPFCIIGAYLKCANCIRRYLAFFKLGTSVKYRKQYSSAMVHQAKWIEAIMPTEVIKDYQEQMRIHRNSEQEQQKQQQQRMKETLHVGTSKLSMNIKKEMWVFNKVYENVSILFGDIVGFTKLSSNQTAEEVVNMLNQLFNQFDKLCSLTECEKIGTLGDCYYCISGCPKENADHALSCIEMGLGMCRILKSFFRQHQKQSSQLMADSDKQVFQVEMRVGIHTGRVNAAIIGLKRFRFDVYSYDVLIANLMESSGRPGFVHISQSTFDLVKTIYNVSQGPPIEVKQEQSYGLAGMKLVYQSIQTYFVDPRSALLSKSSSPLLEPTNDYQSASEYVLNQKDWTTFEQKSQTDKEIYLLLQKYDEDFQLIKSFKSDPECQYKLFQSPPIWPIILQFYNRQTEHDYNAQLYADTLDPIHIDSQKVAPIMDVCICAVVGLFMEVNFLLVFPHYYYIGSKLMKHSLMLLTFVYIPSSLCLLFISCSHKTKLIHRLSEPLSAYGLFKAKFQLILYRIVGRNIVKELCITFVTMGPTIIFYLITTNMILEAESEFVTNRSYIAIVSFQCLLIHSVPLSSSNMLIRLSSIFISLGTILYVIYQVDRDNFESEACTQFVIFRYGIAFTRFRFIYIIELIVCLLIVMTISRVTETNSRLCFYVSRQAHSVTQKTQQAMLEAQELLNNIIPDYVIKQIELKHGLTTSSISSSPHLSFQYAKTIHNAGVAFASISNFFSNYYREDYKGGENALKLLNLIICHFDDLLDLPEMASVEKIKTINDCYMVAAGLNLGHGTLMPATDKHLVALMNYCHMLVASLAKFNDLYIVGDYNRFEIKIGYNIGSVIAGLIGTTKPMYDIWGNTVNVASRMYSTGIVNRIQVSEEVKMRLDASFRFTVRGQVFVKGKGMMNTFLCNNALNEY